jgi:hypothetical protein
VNQILLAVWNFPSLHPIAFAAICTGTATGAQWIWNSFIGALPAPTATSSDKYKFWFRFLNLMAANIERSKGPKVENSPNFEQAVNKVNAQSPEEKPVVVVEAPKS